MELLDNPLTYQSQLIRSTFSSLVGMNGTSEMMSENLKKELFYFINNNIEYWPCFYAYNKKEYRNKFFLIKKWKTPSPIDSLLLENNKSPPQPVLPELSLRFADAQAQKCGFLFQKADISKKIF